MNRVGLVAALVFGMWVGWTARGQSKARVEQQRSPLTITRIFAGADGESHALPIAPVLTPAAPPTTGWIDASEVVAVRQFQVLRTSPDYFSDFHPARNRQYVVMSSF